MMRLLFWRYGRVMLPFQGLKPASASFFTNNLTKATSRPLAMHPRVVSAGLYTCPVLTGFKRFLHHHRYLTID